MTLTLFTQTKNHSVTQSSFEEPCRPLSNGIFSGFVASHDLEKAALITFTIEVKDKEPLWFYCGQTVDNHCQSGMLYSINPPTSGERTFQAFKERARSAAIPGLSLPEPPSNWAHRFLKGKTSSLKDKCIRLLNATLSRLKYSSHSSTVQTAPLIHGFGIAGQHIANTLHNSTMTLYGTQVELKWMHDQRHFCLDPPLPRGEIERMIQMGNYSDLFPHVVQSNTSDFIIVLKTDPLQARDSGPQSQRSDPSQVFPKCRDFFHIVGPGAPAFGRQAGITLYNAISSGPGAVVQQVGDGVILLTLDAVSAAFQDFVITAQSTSKACCVIMRVHGMEHSDGLRVNLGADWYPISDVLKIFQFVEGKLHVSLVIASSYSNAAVSSLATLSLGSAVVTLSDTVAIDTDVESGIVAMSGKWKHGASILDLFNIYLIDGLRNRLYPRLSIVGGRSYNVNEMFVEHIGKPISPGIVSWLEKEHQSGGLLNAVASKIAGAKHEYSIDAVEYGAALSLVLAESIFNGTLT